MARTRISDKTPVDPLFPIPFGAEDEFTYTRELGDDVVEVLEELEPTSNGEDILLDEEGELSSDGDGSQNTLTTPEVIAIVSQTLRRAPGGQQVVDVVLNVEDIEGAQEYEIKVTKI